MPKKRMTITESRWRRMSLPCDGRRREMFGAYVYEISSAEYETDVLP